MFKIRPTLIAGNYMSCNTMLSHTTRPIYLAYLCRGNKKTHFTILSSIGLKPCFNQMCVFYYFFFKFHFINNSVRRPLFRLYHTIFFLTIYTM